MTDRATDAGADTAIDAVFKASYRRLLIAFFLIQLLIPQYGGNNPGSRFALMSAICSEATFRIDTYKNWTTDWAQTPDGHYFSNKAPGPALVGLPVYCLLNLPVMVFTEPGATRVALQDKLKYVFGLGVCLLFQILPLLFLTGQLLRELKQRRVSESGQRFFVFASLFGTTGVLFMNSWFGHGFSLVVSQALLLALLRQKWFAVGLMFGLAVLSDYAAVLLIPLVASLVFWPAEAPASRLWTRRAGAILLGGLLPLAVFAFYHHVSFGGPLILPNRFQNPVYQDLKTAQGNIWGIFKALPDLSVLAQLLGGAERGILFTQPWVLGVIGIFLWVRSASKPKWLQASSGALILSLVLFLMMNASFGAWRGGYTSGPRYLSSVLAFFPFFGAFAYERGGPAGRGLLDFALGYTVLVFFFAFATTIGAREGIPIWQGFWEVLAGGLPTFAVRAGLMAVLAVWVGYARPLPSRRGP